MNRLGEVSTLHHRYVLFRGRGKGEAFCRVQRIEKEGFREVDTPQFRIFLTKSRFFMYLFSRIIVRFLLQINWSAVAISQ